jgi:adenylate kinase family enzyme
MAERARRIEIVGVAGTGKSTLARALTERDPFSVLADTLHTRVPAHWPLVAEGLVRLLPLLVSLARSRKTPKSWDDVKLLLYVSEWQRTLRHGSAPTIFDQGPIYAVARLLWGATSMTTTEPFRAWAREALERWSRELDVVVALAAPNDVLLERIERREKGHEAKGKPRDEALRVLDRHAVAYEQVLSILGAIGQPPVVRFDTSVTSTEEIVARLEPAVQPLTLHTVDGHPENLQAESERAAARGCC